MRKVFLGIIIGVTLAKLASRAIEKLAFPSILWSDDGRH